MNTFGMYSGLLGGLKMNKFIRRIKDGFDFCTDYGNDTFVTKKLGWRIDFYGEMYKLCFDLVKSEISILAPRVDIK